MKKYDEAVALVGELGQASISLVQRYMKIGYNRAAHDRTDGARRDRRPLRRRETRKVLIRKLPQ